MRAIPAKNPPNPWHSQLVEYLGEPPEQPLDVYEDHTKSILADNDSPDLGFRWSLNPYRGCQHACAYCLSGDTQILMSDGTTRALSEVKVGDEIYGTRLVGHYRRYVQSSVIAHWSSIQHAYRVELEDGTEIIASGDHRFLTERGWKHVAPGDRGQRPHLTIDDELRGTGRFAAQPTADRAYRVGYLCGLSRGEGLPGADLEALDRAESYLTDFDVATHRCGFRNASGSRPMQMIRTSRSTHFQQIEQIEWPLSPEDGWRRGFLAGIFDAEGCYSRGVLRIFNQNTTIVAAIEDCLAHFGWSHRVETSARGVRAVRILGGVREHLRFFHAVDPAISRKRSIAGQAIENDAALGVRSIAPLGIAMRMYDITTTTGDFIANGVVSHNCYARPSHEYLGFGAGTDFDRRIAVKPRAPELLREAFEKRSWTGELVMFSGNTDCYQPLEASYELTRRCLQVCAEYRNPVHIITKAALIERDIDVISELVEKTSYAGVSVSIPFWDAKHARAIEPFAPTPERRMRAVERLANAGVPVTVNVAPVIPGLSDPDIPSILEAAAAAGARRAALILLRLPGPVKEVFEDRLRAALPLRADKVLARTREIRGGKLNDPRFGERFRGQGQYYDAIRTLFETTARRLGLLGEKARDDDDDDDDDVASSFRRPTDRGGQLRLFG